MAHKKMKVSDVKKTDVQDMEEITESHLQGILLRRGLDDTGDKKQLLKRVEGSVKIKVEKESDHKIQDDLIYFLKKPRIHFGHNTAKCVRSVVISPCTSEVLANPAIHKWFDLATAYRMGKNDDGKSAIAMTFKFSDEGDAAYLDLKTELAESDVTVSHPKHPNFQTEEETTVQILNAPFTIYFPEGKEASFEKRTVVLERVPTSLLAEEKLVPLFPEAIDLYIFTSSNDPETGMVLLEFATESDVDAFLKFENVLTLEGHRIPAKRQITTCREYIKRFLKKPKTATLKDEERVSMCKEYLKRTETLRAVIDGDERMGLEKVKACDELGEHHSTLKRNIGFDTVRRIGLKQLKMPEGEEIMFKETVASIKNAAAKGIQPKDKKFAMKRQIEQKNPLECEAKLKPQQHKDRKGLLATPPVPRARPVKIKSLMDDISFEVKPKQERGREGLLVKPKQERGREGLLGDGLFRQPHNQPSSQSDNWQKPLFDRGSLVDNSPVNYDRRLEELKQTKQQLLSEFYKGNSVNIHTDVDSSQNNRGLSRMADVTVGNRDPTISKIGGDFAGDSNARFNPESLMPRRNLNDGSDIGYDKTLLMPGRKDVKSGNSGFDQVSIMPSRSEVPLMTNWSDSNRDDDIFDKKASISNRYTCRDDMDFLGRTQMSNQRENSNSGGFHRNNLMSERYGFSGEDADLGFKRAAGIYKDTEIPSLVDSRDGGTGLKIAPLLSDVDNFRNQDVGIRRAPLLSNMDDLGNQNITIKRNSFELEVNNFRNQDAIMQRGSLMSDSDAFKNQDFAMKRTALLSQIDDFRNQDIGVNRAPIMSDVDDFRNEDNRVRRGFLLSQEDEFGGARDFSRGGLSEESGRSGARITSLIPDSGQSDSRVTSLLSDRGRSDARLTSLMPDSHPSAPRVTSLLLDDFNRRPIMATSSSNDAFQDRLSTQSGFGTKRESGFYRGSTNTSNLGFTNNRRY